MKTLLLAVLVLFCVTIYSEAHAYWTRDSWGHRTKSENLWKDRDGDGVPNYYDRRDDNRYIR